MAIDPEVAFILLRLDRVEKQNLRLKQAGAVVSIFACAIVLMGQARPHSSKTIEAERFVVKDSNGKIRAAFGMEDHDPKGATLSLGSAGISASGKEEKYVVYIHGGDLAWLILRKPGSSEYIHARLSGEIDQPSPQISVRDDKGFQTDIGHTAIETKRTGRTQDTSAASIVMNNNDGNVLWSAPNQ